MSVEFEVEVDEHGRIVCFLTGDLLEPKPEEWVRQRYLRILHHEYGYPKERMRREVPIQHGHAEMRDRAGNAIRADIVLYHDRPACSQRNQGRIKLLVECKAPTESEGYNQLVSYTFNTSAEGCVWFNGSGEEDEVQYYRRLSHPASELVRWVGIPRYGESWDALGRRRKSDLLRPRDIKGLLRRCHNRLHGRGSDGEEEDLTLDMVRIILAKAQDEESPSDLPQFYCTPEEYRAATGRRDAAERVRNLFELVKLRHAGVFSEHERITVSDDSICDVAVELQDYQLLVSFDAAQDWDIMGQAYEQYTSVHLKRQRGQFFTNRLVVDLMVAMVDPSYDDIILDPAGGSGGFLTGAMRHVRNKVQQSRGTPTSKQRQLDRHRNNLFMVEASRRLVKVAKTAMILNGDGHTGMTAGNSLGDYSEFDNTIVARAPPGRPTVILTNPPFAGVGEGRITQEDTLARFETGKKWTDRDGPYSASEEIATEGVPPELLFLERCVEWLAPGGRLGIVMPKSFLDTATYRSGRELLFRHCVVLAVVNCHKNTFQPHTGVRTCLFVARKRRPDEPVGDYDIFMAISRKIGQDSEGVPIFKRDPANRLTDEIDHDLDEVLSAYRESRRGDLAASGYRFVVRRSSLDECLNINPQKYLPHLNETLERVAALDGVDGWSVTTLGELEPDIRIFKGPRFKSENIIVEEAGPATEPYYTPSALLQERSESAKLIDIARATPAQLRTIEAIRVRRGDIVITRSGSIGRVNFITSRYHNAIVSDDLIRVKIGDVRLRNYVYGFLQTKFAQDQMLRNEYGAVQQHLEPVHVSNLLVPLPDDPELLEGLAQNVAAALATREQLESENQASVIAIADGLAAAVGLAGYPDAPIAR